ncbi:hypothetical protein [Chlamydiifrater phoenicopteri]|uniref:hypothetical protein n=1 Tax=Chlamydiifrater phoenicopteri TaxID=2681469 RepID=UPI001BCB15B0|nr:hypothetical protein [Chlamydiifrater phoenicopteri]
MSVCFSAGVVAVVLGSLSSGISVLVLSNILASFLSLVIVGFSCSFRTEVQKLDSVRLMEDVFRDASLVKASSKKFLEKGKFLSSERSFRLLVKIGREESEKEKAALASLVVLGGGFVKPEVKKRLCDLTEEHKIRLAFPFFAKFDFELPLDYDSCLEEHIIKKMEGNNLKEEEKESISKMRFSRELFCIALGVFSESELKSLHEYLDALGPLSGQEDLDGVYSELILKFPKLVALEALSLNWLKNVFPYVLSSEFLTSYSESFLRGIKGVANLFPGFFTNFSGVIPAVLLSLCQVGTNNFNFSKKMTWSFFVDKAMQYFRQAHLRKGFMGSMEKFREFLEKGDSVFSESFWDLSVQSDMRVSPEIPLERDSQILEKNLDKEDRPICDESQKSLDSVSIADTRIFAEDDEQILERERVETESLASDFNSRSEKRNFTDSPYPLWNLSSLCAENANLSDKIEEGLSCLEEIECLGGSLKDILQLERIVLGLE